MIQADLVNVLKLVVLIILKNHVKHLTIIGIRICMQMLYFPVTHLQEKLLVNPCSVRYCPDRDIIQEYDKNPSGNADTVMEKLINDTETSRGVLYIDVLITL